MENIIFIIRVFIILFSASLVLAYSQKGEPTKMLAWGIIFIGAILWRYQI